VRSLIIALGILCVLHPAYGADESPFLEQARAVKAVEGDRLVRLARTTLTRVVRDGQLDPVVPIQNNERGAPFGVFVTLVNGRGVTRGCYGSMEPMGRTLSEITVEAALGAARYDVRVTPVSPAELHGLQVIVSLVGPTVPVVAMSEVDPERHGLLVRSGTRHSVLLPGEARTSRWQLKRSLRQVGIRRGESYEMFRFRTVTIYEP
jgi:AMMECR1 domain-containing protein